MPTDNEASTHDTTCFDDVRVAAVMVESHLHAGRQDQRPGQ